jgi:hypothetical protein
MRQANSDWAVAELTAEQGFHSQACYHYGQATEKALKALLISLGSPPPTATPWNAWSTASNQQGWMINHCAGYGSKPSAE